MRAATTVAVNPKTPSQREGQITKGLERYQDMAEYNADAVQAEIDKDKTIGKQEGKAIHSLLKGRTKDMATDQQDAEVCSKCNAEIMYESPDNFDSVCYEEDGGVHCEGCCTCGDDENGMADQVSEQKEKDMAEAQQGAYENYQIVAQAQALEIMFLDSLRVGPFRIAEITSGLTNAKIMAIVKDGDTSPVPATFNTRQAAVNYCVEQIQTGDICYHPCGAY